MEKQERTDLIYIKEAQRHIKEINVRQINVQTLFDEIFLMLQGKSAAEENAKQTELIDLGKGGKQRRTRMLKNGKSNQETLQTEDSSPGKS